MKNKFYSLSVLSIFFLAYSMFVNREKLKAEEVIFEPKKCVENFITQGLSRDQANFWCNQQKDCWEASQNKGIPADVAESLCQCVIDEFKQSYTVQEFQNLNQQAKTDKSAAAKLTEVGEACFEDILFEE